MGAHRRLGIDYGPGAGADLQSAGARWYAQNGMRRAAYAYERLCELVGDMPDESDGLYPFWMADVQAAQAVFGEGAAVVMEAVQRECDPTYQGGFDAPGVEPAARVAPAPGAPAPGAPASIPIANKSQPIPRGPATQTVPAVVSRIPTKPAWSGWIQPFGGWFT